MIGRLTGKILDKSPPTILIDVQGVGYEVEAPLSTFYNLPMDRDQLVTLHTHLIIRDDAHLLFGFTSIVERTMFRTLIKVNGVGAKMALAILSGMTAEEFTHCIQADDAVGLTRLPGIGKKTAERLIIEMRDKLPKISASAGEEAGSTAPIGSFAPKESAEVQASAALESLGYKPAEAARMVARIKQEDLTTEELIRLALQGTMKH